MWGIKKKVVFTAISPLYSNRPPEGAHYGT
jgi:hypothetical protein